MTVKNLPIGTYGYDNEQASARKLVNCTAELGTPDSGNTIIVRRMPGIDSFATTATTARGEHTFKGELYIVAGTSLFKVTSAGVVTTIGTIPGSKKVRIADNGIDMVIVTNPDAYSTDGVTVTQITDSIFTGFGGASDVGYLDGFLIFTVPDSRTAFNTKLFSLTFDALDFKDIDGSPDNLVGIIVDHREAIFLKETSTELYYNAGISPGFPLARSPSGYIEIGCKDKFTSAKIGESVYWLADDGTMRQLNGNQPLIISNVGIAKFIRGGVNPYGFAYTFEDKHYYCLNFDGVTIEYDILAKEWHNRETFTKDRWNILSIFDVYGSTFAIDNVTGDLGELNNLTRTEYGEIMKASWTYQAIESEGHRIIHNRLELSIGTGVGLTSGQGSDPLIELFISDDGGKQFYSFDTRSLGKVGEYLDRVFWPKLGSSYSRVYRCEISDAVDVLCFNTSIELTGGQF